MAGYYDERDVHAWVGPSSVLFAEVGCGDVTTATDSTLTAEKLRYTEIDMDTRYSHLYLLPFG
jgi:hypothetical protein